MMEIARENQIIEKQYMCCVLCASHTCMNPPIQRVCTLRACTQAFCACMRKLVCLLYLLAHVCIMGNGQSSIKS